MPPLFACRFHEKVQRLDLSYLPQESSTSFTTRKGAREAALVRSVSVEHSYALRWRVCPRVV